MFFWVGFGNAEKRMLNLDCRCSIVVDYMFRELVLGECEGYIARKRAEVAHSKEEIHANLEFLKGKRHAAGETARTVQTARAVPMRQPRRRRAILRPRSNPLQKLTRIRRQKSRGKLISWRRC